MIDNRRELAADADGATGLDFHSELVRHALAIQALNQRIHQDSISLTVAVSSLLGIAEALGISTSTNAEIRQARPGPHDGGSPKLDAELSQAVARITDPQMREIMERRLGQLGYVVAVDRSDDANG